MSQDIASSKSKRALRARAMVLGERIRTTGLERADAISASPLAFHVNEGFVALYRSGVAVLAGLSVLEEDETIAQLGGRIESPRTPPEDEEIALLQLAPDGEDKIPPGGPILLKDFSEARFLIIADALAKSVALTRDEGRVNAVFETIAPFAQRLAETGKPIWRRGAMLKLIGQALLTQHRVSGGVAIDEKPDILWDRPDLERLYARLNDEYEIAERAQTLKHKLDVIVETARAATDIIESNRATRLETIVILLIFTEIILSLAQIFYFGHPH